LDFAAGMTERKYLPTFAELVDRLSIVILKSVFIPENREAYLQERADIEADLKLLLGPQPEIARGRLPVGAEEITAIMIIMLANRFIWENESIIRQTPTLRDGTNKGDANLRLTHTINGVRNTAKNVISRLHGDRIDLKVDCLAADLPKQFGNWDLFK
jgi:hypothetical protein